MRRTPPRLALAPSLALTLTLAISGCSDGESSGTPDAGPLAVDQCLGASDAVIVAMHQIDAGGMDAGVQTLDGIGMGCAVGPCLGVVFSGTDDEIDACMAACYEDSTAAGLSAGCRDCYVEAVLCGRDHCPLVCAGSDVQLCADCLETNGCLPRMHACTGL